MIELTELQRQELEHNGDHVRVVDPATKTEYVLLRADVFARLQQLRLVEQAEDEAEQEAWADAVEEARSEMANE